MPLDLSVSKSIPKYEYSTVTVPASVAGPRRK